jgi:[CysO sulfur-carrier protein]-S-L-cysteine hydrolase
MVVPGHASPSGTFHGDQVQAEEVPVSDQTLDAPSGSIEPSSGSPPLGPSGRGDEVFELDRRTWDILVEHAWSDAPFEVCGLLGIRPDRSIVHYPIDNAERSMTYYVMDGKQLLRAMREIEDEGYGLAIYHSHTHTQAYPSATDIRLAAYPEATYLIVTLQDRDAPEIRAFDILDGEVTEKPVVVRDEQVA